METPDLARRDFLRGRRVVRQHETRPPWAQTEPQFSNLCTRCGDCISACRAEILTTGASGFPIIDFREGECSFCRACVEACSTSALRVNDDQSACWTYKATISNRCLAAHGVECRVCGERCPTGAVKFRAAIGGIARLSFDESICNGCGACAAPCPADAITIQEPAETPAQNLLGNCK